MGLPEVWLVEVCDTAGTGVALDAVEPGKNKIKKKKNIAAASAELLS